MMEYLKKSYVQKRQNLRLLRLIQNMLSSASYGPSFVLDIGGGEGFLAGKIKELYPTCAVVNLDLNEELVRTGRSLYPQVEHICVDFLDWETDWKFDLIVSSNVFHWFGGLWFYAVQKVYDLLEEGGWFFLHQGGRWTYFPLYETARKLFLDMFGKDVDPYRKLFYPTQKKLVSALKKAGFKELVLEKRIETQDYTKRELYESFSVAGLSVFLEEIEEEQQKEIFKVNFIQKCEEDDIPVFAVRHYCVVRKPLVSVSVKEGTKEEILPILEEASEDFFPPLTQRNPSVDDYLKEVSPLRIFVAYHPVYKNVGCACVGRKMLPFTSKPVFYLSTIAVKKSFRRVGVGEKLYREILKVFPELYTRTWSTNQIHKNLLEKLGFEKVYVVENDRGDRIHTEYYMWNATYQAMP